MSGAHELESAQQASQPSYCQTCQMFTSFVECSGHQMIQKEDVQQYILEFQEQIKKDSFYLFMEQLNLASEKLNYLIRKYQNLIDINDQLTQLNAIDASDDKALSRILNKLIAVNKIPFSFSEQTGLRFEKSKIKLHLDQFVLQEKSRVESLYQNILGMISHYSALSHVSALGQDALKPKPFSLDNHVNPPRPVLLEPLDCEFSESENIFENRPPGAPAQPQNPTVYRSQVSGKTLFPVRVSGADGRKQPLQPLPTQQPQLPQPVRAVTKPTAPQELARAEICYSSSQTPNSDSNSDSREDSDNASEFLCNVRSNNNSRIARNSAQRLPVQRTKKRSFRNRLVHESSSQNAADSSQHERSEAERTSNGCRSYQRFSVGGGRSL